MSRRWLLRLQCICVLVVVHFVLLLSCRNLFAASERPNFIFVITDDISPDDLEVYGNKSVKTRICCGSQNAVSSSTTPI